ncbi:MAG: GTP 3',8-cyclase MoaA [Nitrososphaerota archaeon]|nr:GTP 3',8-cyclase MoaA [Nitrososphaerota archaeon]MDG7023829.1 GTP 3',8-cyclase MoaA [Nitrososphaerota archaeon]
MSEVSESQNKALSDSRGRVAKKLRIQVTDRCNYRCDFCMPPNPIWLERKEILSFEEITRVSGILAKMGVEKIRLSGGEPLVRRDVDRLVASLVAVPGIRNVSLTTNGSMLKKMAAKLKESGLSGVTLSLHSLKPDRYESITGAKNMLGRVLDGMDEAMRVGIPLKINCVIRRGNNDDEVPDFVRLARRLGVSVRFIEYMPFDGKRFWDEGRVVSGAEIIAKAAAVSRLVALPRDHGSTATAYRFEDGAAGEICTITSMTKPFCSDCERIRLTAKGKIVPCLFSKDEYDVRSLLRGGAGDEEIASFVRNCYGLKFEGVESLIRQNATFGRVRPMHTIGG